MKSKIRIKDIAERAGVSVGTVDRVLHNRPNVSPTARERVEIALKEMEYKPNAYASALALNREYLFVILLPKHEKETYWEEVEKGVEQVSIDRSDFKIRVERISYDRFDASSFRKQLNTCLERQPDGVTIVPFDKNETTRAAETLRKAQIPFVFLDSYIPGLQPLSFFGQDSFSSGFFAARMLMLFAREEKEIMLMKMMKNGRVSTQQQVNRESGFRHFMQEQHADIKILEAILPGNPSEEEAADVFDQFFKVHPNVHHCITFNSKAHVLGTYLLKRNRRNIKIAGYDVVGKNVDCLKGGSISFLIAQHAFQQGYYCIETLFKAIVLKQPVSPMNLMPIEFLTRENIDFYHRAF